MVTNEQIEKAYIQLFAANSKSLSVQSTVHYVKTQFDQDCYRIATRLWLDPFYKQLFEETYSYKQVLEAGYFDDGSWDSVFLRLDQEVSRLLTPFQNILDGLKTIPVDNAKPLVVLLTTGCFAPVHNGHFNMMEQAKITAEKAGYHVLAGFMSPSHDSYVNTKDDGNAKMNIVKRIQLLELAAQNHPWINIDPWEAVYNSIGINFTDVISYLQNYINYHISFDTNIEVIYVFGADNFHFAPTFKYKGKAVVITRYGYSIPSSSEYGDNTNIMISQIPNKLDISSTNIRRGYLEHLPDSVLEIYRNSTAIDKPRLNINIAIRKDSTHSLSNWINSENRELMNVQYQQLFATQLNIILLWAFDSHDTKIYEVDLTKQQNYIAALRKKRIGTVISLDALCPVASNVRLSRLFPICGNQLKRIDTVLENSKILLNKKISKCFVVDDDIVSGKTMEWVVNNFIPFHMDTTKISLLPHGLDAQHSDIVFDEILDERDFLIGSKDGGLLCLLPNGKHVRVPYMLPFVNPLWRASMDAESVITFSREMWMRNVDFFSVNTDILVSNSDPKSRDLFIYLGYNLDTSLFQIACDYHTILDRYKM